MEALQTTALLQLWTCGTSQFWTCISQGLPWASFHGPYPSCWAPHSRQPCKIKRMQPAKRNRNEFQMNFANDFSYRLALNAKAPVASQQPGEHHLHQNHAPLLGQVMARSCMAQNMLDGKDRVEVDWDIHRQKFPTNNMPWLELPGNKMFEAACQLPAAARAANSLQQEPANGLPPRPGRTAPLRAAGGAKTYWQFLNFRAGRENPNMK